MLFTRLILFILAIAAGVVIIRFREKIVRVIGKNDLAEHYLGMGGTYRMWVFIGMILMFAGLLILLGKFAFMGL